MSFDEFLPGRAKAPPRQPVQPPPPRPTPSAAQPIPPRPADAAWEASLTAQLPRGLEDPPGALPGQSWVEPAELTAHRKWRYRSGGIFLGFREGQAIGREDDRHVFIVAGSRTGKGVSVILPNACLWPGSLVVVDPKGDVARQTHRFRKRGLGQRRVLALDPFERTAGSGIDLGGFNPLEEVYPPGASYQQATRKQHEAAIDNADLIADSLVVPNERDAHWTDSAQQLLKGLILYTLTRPNPREHNLFTVRALLTLAHPDTALSQEDLAANVPFDALLLDLLEGCKGFDGIVAGVGRSLRAMADKERGSILSTANAQTRFLESGALKDCLSRSTFRLADLKHEPSTLYLCLPAGRMGTHARWLRIVINMLLHALEETPGKAEPPVLICLDEFNVLGKMKQVSDAAGQMAGFGVKLMVVLQDINQLKEHYPKTWETFVGNSGLFITFGNSDVSTLEYISKKLGTTTVMAASTSTPSLAAAQGGTSGNSLAPQTVPLLAPHEVERIFARERERLLVVFPGASPIVLQRCISYEDAYFKGLLTP